MPAQANGQRTAGGQRVLADFFVLREDIQQVEVLAFIFVQTLNLNIENRLRVNLNPGTNFHKLSQTYLIGLLDITPGLAEFSIISVLLKIDQLIEIVRPLFFQRFIKQRSQIGRASCRERVCQYV